MVNYLLLAASVVLFASQFVFNQSFEREEGSSFGEAMLFSLYSSAFGFAVLFALSGFKLRFSAVSLLYAVLYAAIGIGCSVASVKSFNSVNLSVYSIFAMLGGMILPSVLGITVFKEEFTVFKAVCYAAVVTALLITVDLKQNRGGVKWYLGVFLLNGSVGVVSVLHQNSEKAVSSLAFLMLARIAATAISLIICVFPKRNLRVVKPKAILAAFLFAAVSGIGNLFVLMSLKHLPASVQYPIVTGGVMLLSLLFDVLRKERVSKKNVIATAFAFLASVAMAF